MDNDLMKKKRLLPFVFIGLGLFCAIIVILLIVLGSKNSDQALRDQLALGEKYLNEMDYDKAILAYKEALEIDPDSTEALNGLHNAYEKWIENDSARATEIHEEEIAYLEGLFSWHNSEQIERLLFQIRSIEHVKAASPTPTSSPAETPTPTKRIIYLPLTTYS